MHSLGVSAHPLRPSHSQEWPPAVTFISEFSPDRSTVNSLRGGHDPDQDNECLSPSNLESQPRELGFQGWPGTVRR